MCDVVWVVICEYFFFLFFGMGVCTVDLNIYMNEFNLCTYIKCYVTCLIHFILMELTYIRSLMKSLI